MFPAIYPLGGTFGDNWTGNTAFENEDGSGGLV